MVANHWTTPEAAVTWQVRLRRYVPILGWLPRYQRTWLTRDAIAGATIWGLLIPEMIAYAGLAGLPPQAGSLHAARLAGAVRDLRHQPSAGRRRHERVGGAGVLHDHRS